MKPGVYPGIPNADYHGGPGISKSGLDLIHRSPMHYHAVVTSANDNREPTAAQAFGTAAHSLILEPAEFVKEYCLALRQADVPHAIDDRDQLVAMVAKLNENRLPKLATTGSKAEQIERILDAQPQETWTPDQLDKMKGAELKEILNQLNVNRPGLLPTSGNRHELAELLRDNGVEVTLWSDVQAEWSKNNGTRTVLTQEQWDQLHAMRDAVMAHPAAGKLLTGVPGVAELSVYWNDPMTGVLCRCRPDWWREDDLLVDLKTTDDASLEGFARSIANWRYDVQAPFYLDGVRIATGRKPRGFVFIAVEKKPPYAVGVYVLDAESLELGRAQYIADLKRYAECERTNTWPGYGDKIQTISVPAWHANKNAHLLDAS
ncbi:exodeoxyribonuclease I [Pseudomonas phage Persinger]|uniref:Exodeoxyribonuclease I n=1 Tax=Pseudomonas phage Persinger TaxID=2749430 RepID=A0A7D7EV97_9CAUD|nr:exonuclease VIII [Pseudomonas phage Persinger]QMP19197.1 exodeoxyribonuclease I [Pseudomonas phage Persinger]